MTPANGPELRDIHLPAAPGWWPPAPGWWILAVLFAAGVAFICAKIYFARRRARRRRALMSELDRCIAGARGNPPMLAASLSQFLRRLTLKTSPRASAFAGEQWMAYLDQQTGTDEFSRGVGRALLDAPFRADATYDDAALIALVRRYARACLESGVAHA